MKSSESTGAGSYRPTSPIELSDGRHGCTTLVHLGACLNPSRSRNALEKWKKAYPKYFPKKQKAQSVFFLVDKPGNRHAVNVWIVEEFEEFRRAHLQTEKTTTAPHAADVDDAEDLSPRQVLEHDKLRANTRLANLKADSLAGRMIERATHNGLMVALIKMIRGKIEEWLEGLPPQMEQLDVVEIREILREAYDLLCQDMYQTTHLKPATIEEVDEFMKLAPDPAKSKAGAAGSASRFAKGKKA